MSMIDKRFVGFKNSGDGLYQMFFKSGYSIALYNDTTSDTEECEMAVYKRGVNVSSAFFPDCTEFADDDPFVPECSLYEVIRVIIEVAALSDEETREYVMDSLYPEDMLSLHSVIDDIIASEECES